MILINQILCNNLDGNYFKYHTVNIDHTNITFERQFRFPTVSVHNESAHLLRPIQNEKLQKVKKKLINFHFNLVLLSVYSSKSL